MQQSPGKSLTNKSNDKISNTGFSEVDVNFNANEQCEDVIEQSPSPGKITGGDGKMFIQNSESDKNGILNNFNSQMDDSQQIDLEGLNESELLAL